MHDALSHAPEAGAGPAVASHADLAHAIDHAAHLLPSQGPITVFVHHNTLHAFEDLPFDEAVKQGYQVYGSQPYGSEEFYRAEVARGRIPATTLADVLLEDLDDHADALIGLAGTRYFLRLAMLEHPLRIAPDAELRWLVAESDTLVRFRPETTPEIRDRLVVATRRWVEQRISGKDDDDLVGRLLPEFAGHGDPSTWSERTWDTFTLQLLWRACHQGVHGLPPSGHREQPAVRRHRDLLLAASGQDIDLLVNEVLIRLLAAFLDQGVAAWTLPDRQAGLYAAFLDLYRDAPLVAPWLAGLPAEIARLEQAGLGPLASIAESLDLLGVPAGERAMYLTETLLALRGWAGMVHQMETNAEWLVHKAPPGTLHEYVAVRLILERLALRSVAGEALGSIGALDELAHTLRHQLPRPARVSVDQRAYLVFQLAQVRGWAPSELHGMPRPVWGRLVEEIEAFGPLERRRIYQLAYERHYRDQALDAFRSQPVPPREPPADRPAPALQVVCCLDEREESFRRHLEETDPGCETFGIAGFFGAAMYYRGVAEAHFRPLCPINIKPRHYVREEPIRTFEDASRLQAEARKQLGRFSHGVHRSSRSVLGGALTGLFGSLATAPLLLRVLAPRRAAQLRRLLGRIVTPPVTRLHLEHTPDSETAVPDHGQLGYDPAEMAAIVGNGLRAMGLTRQFAPLVLLAGHGASSLNNPHGAAYDCGACGGAPGGANARAFAQMANDRRVRRILERQGLNIPDETYFVGGLHNTTDDSMVYFDLDHLPHSHHQAFQRALATLNEARKRNAHERCRRFASAPLTLSTDEALRHVEDRAEDLSQTRPECGHATNAIGFVGRRDRTRGLFLDRRTFLVSYDAAQDTPESTILAGLLAAVIPVCGGINLEYYFSAVDPTGYGCGTKLPHNITSLIGVMDGAASDLRPGLPWQMVEIHEPMRLLFVIEATPQALQRVIAGNPTIARMVGNGWVQLATIDPDSTAVHIYRQGQFVAYEARPIHLPEVTDSESWYRGSRDHLGFARIALAGTPTPTAGQEVARC